MSCARIILTALLCCAALGRANPLSGGADNTVERPPNPFDGGAIDSCVTPNATLCGIDYQVPEYVASIAPVLLSEISAELNGNLRVSEDCLNTLKEILCAQKFPRCYRNQEGTVQVEHAFTETCESRLREACSSRTVDTLQSKLICGFPNLTTVGTPSAAAAPCKPISSYDYSSRLQICDDSVIDDETKMTPWMFEVLKQKDAASHHQIQTALSDLDPSCRAQWAGYFCKSVGRCNSDGTRSELVITMEQCEMLLGCFSHMVAEAFSETIPCSLWPNRPLFPVVPSETPSDSSYSETVNEVKVTTTQKKISWPSPDSGLTLSPDKISGSPAVVQSTNMLLLALTVVVALLNVCLRS